MDRASEAAYKARLPKKSAFRSPRGGQAWQDLGSHRYGPWGCHELVPDRQVVHPGPFEWDDPIFAGEMKMTWLPSPVPGGIKVTTT
jgi:hypothetical protein